MTFLIFRYNLCLLYIGQLPSASCMETSEVSALPVLLPELWPTSVQIRFSILAVMGTAPLHFQPPSLTPRVSFKNLGMSAMPLTGHGEPGVWSLGSSLYLTAHCHHFQCTVASSCCHGTRVVDSS